MPADWLSDSETLHKAGGKAGGMTAIDFSSFVDQLASASGEYPKRTHDELRAPAGP